MSNKILTTKVLVKTLVHCKKHLKCIEVKQQEYFKNLLSKSFELLGVLFLKIY